LAHVEATETATTVIHIGRNDIDQFRVVIPENNVLNTFNRIYQPLYDTTVRAKWETHKLIDIRDTLLPKLISGEIRAPDIDFVIGDSIRELHRDPLSKGTA
jgi:type I restriction enzyme S subunit